MVNLKKIKHVCAVALVMLSSQVIAGPESYKLKGYIQNDSGNKCWYTQKIVKGAKYFHGSLKGTIGVLTFNEPECMGDSGVGLDTNKSMINHQVAKWYSHPDARFQTRSTELYNTSLMQKKGQCIQSTTYPDFGIVIDYTISRSSITQVRHGMSVDSCSN